MTDLPWSMSANMKATPNEGAQFICQACCAKVRLSVNEIGYCITECPDHPQVMIRDGKVVGDKRVTEFEIKLAQSLANCSFLPGSSHKRFCRNMGDVARLSPDKEISLRQRHYMELMAWRYRRQLSADLVPQSKPLDLPRPVKPPKEPKAARIAKVGVVPSQGNLL